MKTIFNRINHAGLEGLEDPLNYRRVLFINNLSLVSSAVSLSVTILVIFEGLYPQFIVTLSGAMLFLLVVYFNHLKRYILARSFFLTLSVSLLTVTSFVAFSQGRFNDVENILIGFMAVNYLLYDGRFRYTGIILIYAVLIWLKFAKQLSIGDSFDLNFYLVIQNTTILCLIVFLFADSFRKSLMRAFVRLKSKDELLYSMIDNVPLFIALVDTEMRYRMVNINYEKTFGKRRSEIIGSSISDILPPNILLTHEPMVKAALKGESPEFLEETEMPDGTTFYAGGKYVPVTADDGKIVGVTVFVSDVTKLEKAKIKLKKANTTKDRLFSIVAHDIRGPLDLFEGLINFSYEGGITREEFLKHQEKIKTKVTDLRITVNSLLEWARSQLDGINSSPSSINVREIIESNMELYRELIVQKKIDFDQQISGEIDAWVDENHLKISLQNMIHNALKFTPRGGKIVTSAEKRGDMVTMTIRDTGVGMDASRVSSIMSKELQQSSYGTEGELGTGLGLSLSMGLLEKNNCRVQITSELTKGTEISIDIPYKPSSN